MGKGFSMAWKDAHIGGVISFILSRENTELQIRESFWSKQKFGNKFLKRFDKSQLDLLEVHEDISPLLQVAVSVQGVWKPERKVPERYHTACN